MNFNKKHILLIALFVLLVSIPLSFATDSNDAQMQESNDINTITTQDTPTITNTTPTTETINTNKKNIKYDSNNDNSINKDINNYDELINTINYAKVDENKEYTLNLLNGDYNATNTIFISENDNLKTLTINGNGLTLDGGSGYQFFKIYNEEFTLNLNNATIYNYHSSNDGGAIDNIDGTVHITNVTFLNNTCDNYGGALHTLFGSYTISNSSFINNSVYDKENGIGGAICCSDYTDKLYVDNTIFINNYAPRSFDISAWTTDLKINEYTELSYVNLNVKDKIICYDEDYNYYNYVTLNYAEGIGSFNDQTLNGDVELILNNESLTTLSQYDSYTIPSYKFKLGTNELKVVYSDDTLSEAINKTVTIFRTDKKESLMYMEYPTFSSINDNVPLYYEVFDSNYEQITKGIVSVYIYNYTSKEYYKYKESNIDTNQITLTIPEITSNSETYPQFIKYYIQYSDESNEYNSFEIFDSFEISKYNLTYIDDVNYDQKTNTITFNVYDQTNENSIINVGKIHIISNVYDTNYNTMLTLETTANINQSTITIGDFNYNDYLGGHINFELYYEDDRENKEFNNSNTNYYHSILKNINVEVEDIEGYIGDMIILPITVKDEDDNNIDLQDLEIYVEIQDYYMNLNTKIENGNLYLNTSALISYNEGNYPLKISLSSEKYNEVSEEFNFLAHVKEKNTHFDELSDIIIYKNDEWTEIHFYVYNEYDQKISNGIVKSYLDNNYINEIEINSYDNYFNFNVEGLTVGNHTIKLVYEDENNEQPSCETTTILVKTNSIETYIACTESNSYISINDEYIDFIIEVNYYDNDNWNTVDRGVITLYLNNSDYTEIKSINATEGNLHIKISDILENYENIIYPFNLNFMIEYTDDSEYFAPSKTFQYTIINNNTNKIETQFSNIYHEETEEGTIFYVNVVDNYGEQITKGKITGTIFIYNISETTGSTSTISGFRKDIDMDVSENQIFLNDLKLEYPVISYDIELYYTDDSDEYEECFFESWYNNIPIPASFNVDEHIYAQLNESITIPMNITYLNGSLVEYKYSIGIFYDGHYVENLNINHPTSEYLKYYLTTPGDYNINLYPENGDYFDRLNYDINPKTITITIESNNPTYHFSDMADRTCYPNEPSETIFFGLYDQNNNPIEGIVSIFIDDIFIGNTDNTYFNINIDDLSYGNHIVKLVFEDDSGQNPSCETTFNLFKSDKIKCWIRYSNNPKVISIYDDDISINFGVRPTFENEDVQTGILSIYVNDVNNQNEEILIKSVNVTDCIITIPIEEIKTHVSQDYPVRDILMIAKYTDETNTYTDCSAKWNFTLSDKKSSKIKYNNYTIENGNTIVYYTLTDNQENNITHGFIKLTGSAENRDYSNYTEFETETNIIDGHILIENIDFSKYPSGWIYLQFNYTDDSNEYEESYLDTNGWYNSIDINVTVDNTNGKVNKPITIPLTISDEFGNEITTETVRLYQLVSTYASMELYNFSYDETTRLLTILFEETGDYPLFVTVDNPKYNTGFGYFNVTIYDDDDTTISRVELDDINTLTNTPTIITANVYDTENNPLNDGTVTFTDENDNILGESTVSDGTASITCTFTEETTTQITATYTPASDNILGSQNTATITIESPITNINIEDVNLESGQLVALTATVTDQFGNSINGGKIFFKVNGKTVKDDNGKVIYVKVVDGVASLEYYVSDDLAGKEVNITAVYSGTSTYNKETATISTTVEKTTTPTLTITPITEEVAANTTITLKAKVSDGDKAITNGKIVFKINGKTVKDDNGKVIYAKVDSNGEVSVDYNIGDLKAKTYNVTAVFISSDYDRLEDSTTLTVV